jgi:hypothetical protein
MLVVLASSPALAQERLSDDEVRELVREVRELRGTVRVLTHRVDELERERAENEARDADLAQAVAALREGAGGDAVLDGGVLRVGTAGFRLSGFAEILYSYNPRSGSRTRDENRFRAGDVDANTFSVQAIQLVLEKEATDPGTWGLRLQAEYGKLADLIDADGDLGGVDDSFAMSEYYATWRTEGLIEGTNDWQIGRFQSPLGYESNENWKNVLVTRNPIYQLGTPTTHSGIRGVVPLSPDVTATVYFVNGWDNQLDDHSSKTGILTLSTSPVADWWSSAFTLNASWGHEGSQEGNSGDKTGFAELMWTTQPHERWRTGLDILTAYTSDAIARPGRGAETRKWHGAAGYVTHDLADDVEMSGRLGYYSDNQFRVGRQRLMDASIAVRYRLADGLTVMLEFRHDWSPDGEPYRKKSGSRTDVQDTVTGSVLVEF